MLTAICNKIDVVMLDSLRSDGEYQSGIYAAGYRFLDASNMFGYLFGALLLPMYSHMYANKIDVKDLFNTAFQILVLLSLPLTLISCFFGKEIFDLFYTQDYTNHSNVFIALMLSLVPIMVSHSIGSLLIAFGRLKWLNIIFLLAVIINIILNYFVIPRYGALGSAYTTFVSELLLILSALFIVIKVCEVTIRREIAIKSLIILLGSLVILFILSSIPTINWLIKVLLFLGSYALLILKLKIITIPNIRLLLNK
jgi:O-antigen/teichoic acid export membrane protein